jgi:hemerythrin-like domain-containing protein
MKKIQPVKRSKQLVSLSKEHHDALLFIWKIKAGLKNGTPLTTLNDYIKWFWENYLKNHFDEEEKVLLPYLQAEDPGGQQLIEEHTALKKMIGDELNETSLGSFTTLLNDHIRFEERTLFPHLERILSEHQLDQIAKQLSSHPQCKADWQDQFWKNPQ